MTMTLAEYQPLAARTAAMDAPHNIRQATFALGLVCEATEVLELFVGRNLSPNRDSLIKELGDVLWYAAGLCTEHDMDLAEVMGDAFEQYDFTNPNSKAWVEALAVDAGRVSDYMKKVVGHGHDLDKEGLAAGVQLVVRSLYGLCQAQGLDLGEVAATNVAKLKARYPDGFSSHASINRTV